LKRESRLEMDDTRDDELIQRYLLGDLGEVERSELERRLESDESLAEWLQSYQSMLSDLSSLDVAAPPAHLWSGRIQPALAEQLGEISRPAHRFAAALNFMRDLFLKPAMVVIAFVVVIFAITFFIQRNVISPQELGTYDRAIANIQQLRERYVAELGTLEAEMENRKRLMSPEIRKAYENTLKEIDQSIAEAERFYFAYPADSDAVKFLFTAYEQKVKFIEQFKQLEPLSPEA